MESHEDNTKDSNKDLYAPIFPSKTDQLARIRKSMQSSGNSRRESLEKVQPVELFSDAANHDQPRTQQLSQGNADSSASPTSADSSTVSDRKPQEKQQIKPRRLETEADALSVGYTPGEASFFPEEVYSKKRLAGAGQRVPPDLPEADSPVPYFTLADAEKLKTSGLNTLIEVDFSIQQKTDESLTSPVAVTELMNEDLSEGATDAQFLADLPPESPEIGFEAPDWAPQNPDFSPEDYAAYAEATGFDDVPEATEEAAYEAELDELTGSDESPFPIQGEQALSLSETDSYAIEAGNNGAESYEEDADDSLDGIPLDYIPGLTDAEWPSEESSSSPDSSGAGLDRYASIPQSSPSDSDKHSTSLSDSDGNRHEVPSPASTKKVQPVELFDRPAAAIPGNNAKFVRTGVRTEPGAGKAVSGAPHTAGMTTEPHTPDQASASSPDKDRTANGRLRPPASQPKAHRKATGKAADSRNVPKTTKPGSMSEEEASLNAALFPNKAYSAPSGKSARRTTTKATAAVASTSASAPNKSTSGQKQTNESMSEADLMPKTSGRPRKKKPNPEQTLRSMLEAMKQQMLAGEGEWITEDMTPDKLGVRANGRAFLKALEKAGIPVFLMPAAIQQYQKPPILAWDPQRKEFILKNRTPPRG